MALIFPTEERLSAWVVFLVRCHGREAFERFVAFSFGESAFGILARLVWSGFVYDEYDSLRVRWLPPHPPTSGHSVVTSPRGRGSSVVRKGWLHQILKGEGRSWFLLTVYG